VPWISVSISYLALFRAAALCSLLFVLLPAQYKLYFPLRKFLLCFRAPIFLSCALPQIPNDRSPRFTPFPFRHKTSPVHPSGCYVSLSGPQCVSLRCRVLTNTLTLIHNTVGRGQVRREAGDSAVMYCCLLSIKWLVFSTGKSSLLSDKTLWCN